MRRLLILAASTAFGLGLSFVPAPAGANCTQSGTIVSLFVQPGAALSSIFLRTSGQVGNVAWFATTADDKLVSAAAAALTSQTRVAMTGNAASCPTSGTPRSMGSLLIISLNP